MENTGFKGLLVTLYQRVVLSYKSTIIGMLIAAGDVIVEQLGLMPEAPAWVHYVAKGLGLVLMLVKDKRGTALPVAPAALVLVGVAMLVSGCSHFRGVGPRIVTCAKAEATAQAKLLAPTVTAIIAGQAVDWDAQLDKVVASVGDIAICAIKEVIASLESNTEPAPTSASAFAETLVVPRSVQLVRAQSYLASLQVRCQ